ncbi:3-oxoacyl-(acyl-carrier-protein) synthase, KASIII [Liberibacter crescens BT-1]|uniref:Beta-ketoacyl-[acyl-carrier-protein] synthase III n=1 Tax=Liberibacter crescens (strain BT-1) TaxID=1215343 RepID=L0ETR3_LIBCB|nr:beta-ketoacyl-ACP synthase III [Liberibacter crescens]AGA64357.1 3-oxoacyl-(acyl-carrier-protein) synthase, KASIII [Liberibacter crescens BT-1]AMC12552.1 3-oxoacyl-ACP synthase [Liberibacter crescens]
MIRSIVRGCGSALPRRILRNSEMETIVDTSDDWIMQRVGISQRHISGENETSASLGEVAARNALSHAGMEADDIDLIILATSTPNYTFPATAVDIQNRLGMKRGFAFDMQAVCSGFIYALSTADVYIRSGVVRRVLVIGADTFSRIVDWSDRSTCVLFGDGAGALILEGVQSEGSLLDSGILATYLRSDGSHVNKLYVNGGPSTTASVGKLQMKGQEVFKYAVEMATEVIDEVFSLTGFTVSDIDWFIPHQANQRIINSIAKKIGFPLEKVVVTVDIHGNTSAASVPLALSVAVSEGRIKKNHLLVLEAMGGGFTSGAILMRW